MVTLFRSILNESPRESMTSVPRKDAEEALTVSEIARIVTAVSCTGFPSVLSTTVSALPLMAQMAQMRVAVTNGVSSAGSQPRVSARFCSVCTPNALTTDVVCHGATISSRYPEPRKFHPIPALSCPRSPVPKVAVHTFLVDTFLV